MYIHVGRGGEGGKIRSSTSLSVLFLLHTLRPENLPNNGIGYWVNMLLPCAYICEFKWKLKKLEILKKKKKEKWNTYSANFLPDLGRVHSCRNIPGSSTARHPTVHLMTHQHMLSLSPAIDFHLLNLCSNEQDLSVSFNSLVRNFLSSPFPSPQSSNQCPLCLTSWLCAVQPPGEERGEACHSCASVWGEGPRS